MGTFEHRETLRKFKYAQPFEPFFVESQQGDRVLVSDRWGFAANDVMLIVNNPEGRRLRIKLVDIVNLSRAVPESRSA
jgi:hypothetical protein